MPWPEVVRWRRENREADDQVSSSALLRCRQASDVFALPGTSAQERSIRLSTNHVRPFIQSTSRLRRGSLYPLFPATSLRHVDDSCTSPSPSPSLSPWPPLSAPRSSARRSPPPPSASTPPPSQPSERSSSDCPRSRHGLSSEPLSRPPPADRSSHRCRRSSRAPSMTLSTFQSRTHRMAATTGQQRGGTETMH